MNSLAKSIISLYQKTISPDHGGIFYSPSVGCRFYPSCSQYTVEAIEEKGLIKGLMLGFFRVLRCNPFSKGGFDPVK